MPRGYVTKNFVKLESAFEKGYTTASLQGSARCFGRGTLVRMADGRLKAVEDIKVGDKLMNMEGNGYNTVTETHNGFDNLYLVRQARGMDYVVNSHHILSLKQTQAKQHKVAIEGFKSAEKRRIEYLPYDKNKIHDFDLQWYLKQSGNFKRLYTGFKNTKVQLPEKQLLIDPYYLGIWLGDGTAHRYYEIANTDKEVLNFFYEYAASLGTEAYQKDKVSHVMRVEPYRRCHKAETTVGKLREAFKHYDLIDNKHVPSDYIYNSYENRLKLLAGLLDTDGCKSGRNTIAFSQKRKEIVAAVEEICRLSGFYTNGMHEEKATMRRPDGSMYETTVWAIEINHNDFNDLNKYMRVERKKVKNKKCDRNYFSSSVYAEPYGYGEYFGFTLDNSPYFLLQDGTVVHNSSKTFSIVQWIIHRCITVPYTSVSIVRETTPAIKRSVYKDFIEIINMWGVDNGKLNKTELVYTFDNGSTVEFFSCENEQKLRGSKRQILYVNEANEISYLEWEQLQMRTTMFSIIDYNPSFSEEHWINQVNDEGKTAWWISTYKDNPFLEQRIIDEIESLQYKNPSLWRVYGLGLRAMVEGLVFPKFEIVNYMPTETMRHRYIGMDFGYTNDPTAIVEVRFYGMDMYIHELCYKTHMLSADIIHELKHYQSWSPEIISESADPRLIDEIYNAGLDIKPVQKYAGSIQAGIAKMQEFNIKITRESTDIIKEFRNYTYRQDKEGKWLNEPIDLYNHGIDGCRYVVLSKILGANAPEMSSADILGFTDD